MNTQPKDNQVRLLIELTGEFKGSQLISTDDYMVVVLSKKNKFLQSH